MIQRPLPSFCYNAGRTITPQGMTIHFLSAINVAPEKAFDPDTCYNLLVDLNTPGEERGLVMPHSNKKRQYASYQYMIDRDGEIYQLVPDNKKAYHAGYSRWNGRDNCNMWMLGAALLGTATSGFTDAQYAALTTLGAKKISQYDFGVDDIAGHEEVREVWMQKYPHLVKPKYVVAKHDPGKLFDWARLKDPLRSVAA